MLNQELIPSIEIYEASLMSAREQNESSVFSSYFSVEDPRTLLLFWINFSSQGVSMTEPVESWIKRAGKRCEELGFIELGKQLNKHAIHEANHHLMMIKDTHSLVNKWNAFYTPLLSAEDLLKRPPLAEIIKYQELHEDCIAGDAPYCQIAIEYEIENLAATHGSKMVDHALEILGESFEESLSFMEEHAQIDVAHTKFNKKVISDFITTYPDALSHLIEAGKKALKTHGDCLVACLKHR